MLPPDEVPAWFVAVVVVAVTVFLLSEEGAWRWRLLVSGVKKFLGVGHA